MPISAGWDYPMHIENLDNVQDTQPTQKPFHLEGNLDDERRNDMNSFLDNLPSTASTGKGHVPRNSKV